MIATSPLSKNPVKSAKSILLLLIGVTLSVSISGAYHQIRRIQAISALPSLADRTKSPGIDELPYITLSRHEGRLHYEVCEGIGGPVKDFETLLALDRSAGINDPIWAIRFEIGVTLEDLELSIKECSALGVKRYFLGSSFYGKSLVR